MLIHDELHELAEKARQELATTTHRINVCVSAGCVSAGSDKVLDALKEEVKNRNLLPGCMVKGVGCMGPCAGGPVVVVDNGKEKVMYNHVHPEDAREIVDSVVNEEKVERLAVDTGKPFFKNQKKVVLRNSGVIDPERLDDALAHDGYEALHKVVTQMEPANVIDEIMKSGLRGRGGAGFPTGLKWSTVAKTGGAKKYLVCNADEGDPGAFMDRAILESDPHRVIEGMAIAAVAVGAEQGFLYVRAEYPLAISRLKKAIRQAERAGILGKRLLGTTQEFHLEIRLGAGAFVCGEETALLNSIQGERGTPRPRPPYPAQEGLFGQSTLINNVETYANIPEIIRKGADWFSSIGTENSKGTKVFALAGKISNTGLIEVPMGTPLREIIEEIGGGVPDGYAFKAVQTGGPSGGCIPAEHMDSSVDYETLGKLGSIMGSGGMIVMDETSNMVDVAKYFMEFSTSESCGKCVPCRVGTTHMYNLLQKILDGKATQSDLELLQELCTLVKASSLCGLGQASPNPVVSTLRYFREEYESLLIDEKSKTAEEAE